VQKINMVDLRGQYEKIKHEIDSSIQEVIDSTAFIKGFAVGQFQESLEKYLDVRHVIPCANGTDALQVSMMALGLKPGDEVITASFTFIATAEVIALLGLTPVFADVDPGTFNIVPEDIERRITKKTRAIIPVHLFGQSADMDKIMQIAKKYDLYVIEDNCQAIGADCFFKDDTSKKAGTIGTIGTTSFFPSKNLGCFGDGGALFTNDDELAKKVRSIVNHGMTVRYYHDDIGVNSRLDTIQAAVLKVKLAYLDEYIAARQKAAAFYDSAFGSEPKLTIPARAALSTHVFHQYTLKLNGVDRAALIEYLAEKGIPAMIYYPVPIHLQKAYEQYGFKAGDLPVTEDLCSRVISLPMHTELDEEQLKYITTSVLEFINQ
jgi:dTDP-4-amino-4,6-dideoxygalactose transaminase